MYMHVLYNNFNVKSTIAGASRKSSRKAESMPLILCYYHYQYIVYNDSRAYI